MIFKGIENQSVELKITNYQFPDIKSGDDANWLNIYIKVTSKFGNWQTIDASLQTVDIIEIIQWFQDWAKNNEIKWNPLEFIEPNLSFEMISYDDNLKSLRIKFNLECRPKSAKDEVDYFVDCLLTNNQLLKLSEDLKNESMNYKKR